MKNFLQYVEIQTKVASIIPFLIGTLFAKLRYDSFHIDNFLLMLVSLLCFDMATTAINNYYDYKKSNVIGTKHEAIASNVSVIDNGISQFMAKVIIFILLSVAILFGCLLVASTNMIVLMIGVLSFVTGILYTFGPIPISRMPLGEIFSGFFMGFVILFLSIYIHIFNGGVASIAFHGNLLTVSLNLYELFVILLVSVPTMSCIANIMLANNICDVEEDIVNNRFTLVYYLGKPHSLFVYKFLYYISYIDIVLLIVVGILPLPVLFVLPTFVVVNKAIKIFYKNQVKSKTFVLAVKNFLTICGTQLITLALTVVFEMII